MAVAPAKTVPHRWSFYRAGGVDQVRLDTGADIFALDQLDQKLWVALSCPVKGLEFDARTLELLDLDKDAHVRPPEIVDAVKWLRDVLKSGDCLLGGKDGYALADLRGDTAEGRMLHAASVRVLESLGVKQTVLTVADATRTAEFFTNAKWNGDGIVPAESVEDGNARQVAADVVACLGPAVDRSGRDGFDRERLDRFFAECAAYDAWCKQGETGGKALLPFGAETAAAHAAVAAVRAKVDDFFARCRLAAFDPRAQAALNREEKAWLEVAAKDLDISARDVAHFPLAMVEPGKALPLLQGVNPAWAAATARLVPYAGKDKTTITEAEWLGLCARLEPFAAWVAARAGGAVEKLGIARVRAVLAGKGRAALEAAIAADTAVAPEIDAIQKCEKLARLCRDFHKLLNNYVSFTDFYARRGAVFQAGTLYLDGRSCDLCFAVTDAAKHGALAAMAKTYLAYVDCSRPSGEKMTVACAFTAGNSENLFAGRNGIFYDRKGRDWNATIARIVDNPISIGQAFWSPYKKVLRFIEESVAKRAAAADAEANARLQAAAAEAGDAARSGKVATPPKKMDIGVLAAISVAISGVTAIVGTVLERFFELGYLMPLGVLGIVLVVSCPSMLIAYMKLRLRNLGPILDANGWAVNTLTKVNIPLGGSLTALPRLPDGATRSLVDPYAPKRSPWPKVFVLLLALAAAVFVLYRTNVLHRWFHQYGWLEYVSTGSDGPREGFAGFDGPHEAFAGDPKPVEVRLGSNAAEVKVVGLDVPTLKVGADHRIAVPVDKVKEGTRIVLTDDTVTPPQTHYIEVKKKP
jgi:hypothetical protein